ncbi:MAG: glycosyltransferase family 4 protein [Lentisphaerae bacterium]|nr:glycosyltransferase family 4 protein [Lentisphaerota bacterium]
MTAAKRPTVAILHYSCPPVIGGVEFIIAAHAQLLAEAGFRTRLLVGKGGPVHPKVRTAVIPELASDGGPHAAVVRALIKGTAPEGLERAVKQTAARLSRSLNGVDVCMIHNVLTMHFNLVLTAALAEVMARRGDRIRFVGWTHDLTFHEPVYVMHQHDRYPWNLMKQALPGCSYCAISEARRKHIGETLGLPPRSVPVIPDGINVVRQLGLTEMAGDIYQGEQIARQDVVLLTPARVLRRKNIELGIEIVAALKRAGQSVRWIITGAPDPHNPDLAKYWRMLNGLRRRLKVQKEIIFLGERFDRPVTDDDLRGLFRLADCLLFPSKREGFGLPILEGGLARLLLVINDIPVFRELVGGDAILIRSAKTPDDVAAQIIKRLAKRPEIAYRKHIMAHYGWEGVFTKWLLPVVTQPGSLWT